MWLSARIKYLDNWERIVITYLLFKKNLKCYVPSRSRVIMALFITFFKKKYICKVYIATIIVISHHHPLPNFEFRVIYLLDWLPTKIIDCPPTLAKALIQCEENLSKLKFELILLILFFGLQIISPPWRM